jgi:hypothetical protein
MSGFEIITITFSFILGLGVAQILRAVAYVVREKEQHRLHWIPLSMALIVLLFQVQFWFALVIVDSFMDYWTWPVYGLLLFLAIVIFLSGATVLPPPGSSKTDSLFEDFVARGKISLIFLALYLVGWVGVAIMFWTEQFVHLVIVNLAMATAAVIAFLPQRPRSRSLLHAILIAMMVYGLITVWTPPSLEEPLTSDSGRIAVLQHC